MREIGEEGRFVRWGEGRYDGNVFEGMVNKLCERGRRGISGGRRRRLVRGR